MVFNHSPFVVDANGHSKIKSKHHVSFKIREGPSSIGMDQNVRNFAFIATLKIFW